MRTEKQEISQNKRSKLISGLKQNIFGLLMASEKKTAPQRMPALLCTVSKRGFSLILKMLTEVPVVVLDALVDFIKNIVSTKDSN